MKNYTVIVWKNDPAALVVSGDIVKVLATNKDRAAAKAASFFDKYKHQLVIRTFTEN